MIDEYFRHAVVLAIEDGDSIKVEIDLGFEALKTTRLVRLLGINAPEKKGDTKEAGLAARDYLAALIPVGTPVVTQTINRRDKYGRYLARVYNGSLCVNEEMLRAGHAVPYLT